MTKFAINMMKRRWDQDLVNKWYASRAARRVLEVCLALEFERCDLLVTRSLFL